MAGKAKFDQEAAFKSIIGAGRETGVVAAEKPAAREKIKSVCSGHTFWIVT